MSVHDGALTIDGLDQWLAWLERQDRAGVEAMKSRILRSIGMVGLAACQDHIHTRSARLKQSLTMGARDNIFELNISRGVSWVYYGTNVSYAAAVNDGITASGAANNKGRFVPGFWQNGVFHYVPGDQAKAQGIGGMVLTGKIIPGVHFIEKSMDAIAAQINRIAEYEFRNLYDQLHRGK